MFAHLYATDAEVENVGVWTSEIKAVRKEEGEDKSAVEAGPEHYTEKRQANHSIGRWKSTIT